MTARITSGAGALTGLASALLLAPAWLGAAGGASTSARFGHAKRATLKLGFRQGMQAAARFRNLTLYACIAFAMLSGAHFGLLGCGGYSWHWKLRQTLELLLSTAWVTLTVHTYTGLSKNERSVFRTIALCVGIYFGMHALFITSMALAAPFYPTPPGSLNDWWQGFWLSWLEGVPC